MLYNVNMVKPFKYIFNYKSYLNENFENVTVIENFLNFYRFKLPLTKNIGKVFGFLQKYVKLFILETTLKY